MEELAQLQRGDLPRNVERLVKAWGGYYGSARIDRVTLIAFQDKATLDEILEHPDLAGRLTPFPSDKRALAAVSEEDLAHVTGVLERLGARIRLPKA